MQVKKINLLEILKEAIKQSERDSLISILKQALDIEIDPEEVVYDHDKRAITIEKTLKLNDEEKEQLSKYLFNNIKIAVIKCTITLEKYLYSEAEKLEIETINQFWLSGSEYYYTRKIKYKTTIAETETSKYNLYIVITLESLTYTEEDDC